MIKYKESITVLDKGLTPIQALPMKSNLGKIRIPAGGEPLVEWNLASLWQRYTEYKKQFL